MGNKKGKKIKKQVPYKANVSNKKYVEPKKKVKIRYGRIFLVLLIVILFFLILSFIYQLPIKNIVIQNNFFLKDQEIIELARLNNYPSNFQNLSLEIKKRLEKNTYIKSAEIKKTLTGKVTIIVEENYPLFYYQPNNKTILLDGKEVTTKFDVPFVINYIPNTKYEPFFNGMSEISRDVLGRISEIKYEPNDVDDSRFLLTMSDGNYVYLTLTRFSLINRYVEIISQEELIGKKGILKLDAGNSFEILEG